ncbi:MAG: hypothetical protein E7511_01050 [Ruminococcus sp.]|nr:hypothetical protein [Ruminococcus sp.]
MMLKTEFRQTRSPEYWLVLGTLCLISVFYYGIRAAAVLGLAAVTAVLTDFICLFLRDRAYKAADLSNVANALILALMFPASIPYSIVILSTVFAVAVGTHVFGTRRDMLFPPAAAGYLFALLSWKEEVLSFPKTGAEIRLFGNDALARFPSMSADFNAEGVLTTDAYDILIGTICGPMGTGCLFLIVLGLLVLGFRKSISWSGVIGFFSGIVLLCFFTRTSPYAALSTNMVLFAALFLAADTNIAPRGFFPPWFGGIFTGALTQYLVYAYDIEYAPVVAVMLSCPVWRGLDALGQKWASRPAPIDEQAAQPETEAADE